MKLKIFTVYDSKAEAYLQPFMMQARGEALRAFTDLANDTNHKFGKYPSDFTLFEIGEYDQLTGKITQPVAHTSLATALELQSQSKPQQTTKDAVRENKKGKSKPQQPKQQPIEVAQ